MRCCKAVLLAKRLHRKGVALTVEAEKGNLWRECRMTIQRSFTVGDDGEEAA